MTALRHLSLSLLLFREERSQAQSRVRLCFTKESFRCFHVKFSSHKNVATQKVSFVKYDLTRFLSLIGKLMGLHELRCVCCSGIVELPSIERLALLETLRIQSCKLPRQLPASMDTLTVLTELYVAD